MIILCLVKHIHSYPKISLYLILEYLTLSILHVKAIELLSWQIYSAGARVQKCF